MLKTSQTRIQKHKRLSQFKDIKSMEKFKKAFLNCPITINSYNNKRYRPSVLK